MRTISSAAAGILVVPTAAAVFLAAPGCRDRSTPGTAGKSTLPAPDATYTTRGKLAALPATPGGAVTIHHEAIPGFRSKSGEVVGMGSMQMPFMPAAGLDLNGLAPGDAIEFTWELRWSARPNSRIVRIEKLPPGTELNFGSPPAGDASK